MDINSIKTKVKQHKHITLKQKDNTSPIELILCGEDGRQMKDLSGHATITLLDMKEKEVRATLNANVTNGFIAFVINEHLKAHDHSLEITIGGRKFPSDGEFTVKVASTHDMAELNIIESITRQEVLTTLDKSIKDFLSFNALKFTPSTENIVSAIQPTISSTVQTEFNKLSTAQQNNSEIISARGNYPALNVRLDELNNVADYGKIMVDDLTVNVRKFKTSNNTWNQALQLAINYANSIYSGQTELGGVFIPQNVLVKMPRGRYTIDTTLMGKNGIDFDFSGCVFIAQNTNKTLDFIDYTGEKSGGGKIFRNHFNKGNFVGFKTVLNCKTGNVDTSNLVWDSPVFQSCKIGVDTNSYSSSRSTYIKIKNIYSIATDLPLKFHTDMANVEGGWIYHSGYDGPAIYNQGFTKIENVVFVPKAGLSTSQPRWIDNYAEDENSNSISGERGIVVDHCRFGGEEGSCPIIYNYATYNTNLSLYKATNIKVENCIVNSTGTNHKSLMVLFKIPNHIQITNVTGMTDLTEGIIKLDPSLNIDAIQNSNYISIELDETTTHAFKLIDERLVKFLKRYQTLNDMFRISYDRGFYGQMSCTQTSDGKPKYTFNINFGDYSTPLSNKMKGQAFLVTIASANGSYAYKNISTYLVHANGFHDGTAVKYGLSYVALKETAGSLYKGDKTTIQSLHWGDGDTGSSEITYGDGTVKNSKVTLVMSTGAPDTAGISIVPLFGL